VRRDVREALRAGATTTPAIFGGGASGANRIH
jgi:hypothetical protein